MSLQCIDCTAGRLCPQKLLLSVFVREESGEMGKIKGSCLCGGVRFQINGPLTGALNCHCSMCRKAHGAAFRSRARVEARDFELLAGEELIKFYESSPGNHRGFCGVC